MKPTMHGKRHVGNRRDNGVSARVALLSVLLLLVWATVVLMPACGSIGSDETLRDPTSSTVRPDSETAEPSARPDTTAASAPETAPSDPVDTDSTTEPPAETETALTETACEIKNVILLIADGGGYDNFELADRTKQAILAAGKNTLGGSARTEITSGKLTPYGYGNGTGLYLNAFLVGSSDTLLRVPHGSDPAKQYITDSSAAGTALATGHKTTYCYTGIDSDRRPLATLTELAQMMGMRTGLVSTKSFVDATPLAFFSAHSIYRYEYQDNSLQAILSGVDVVLVEGTEYGDIPVGGGASSHIGASRAGYTVVESRTAMWEAIKGGAAKLWGAFPGRVHGESTYATADQAADHLAYDIDLARRDEPTLRDMAAAALDMLAGQQDPDGFFLMIEAGALDNAAEVGKLRQAVGEALAFDETFAMCVEWAKQNGDNTLILATADHDSGGFAGIEGSEEALIESLLRGRFPDGTRIAFEHEFDDYKTHLGMDASASLFYGHSDMPVPVWLYAPENRRAEVIAALGLPADTAPDKIRYPDKGRYYDLAAINEAYLIDNTAIAPVLAGYLSETTLDEATEAFYVPVATYNDDGTITYHSGITEGTLTFGPLDTRRVGTTTVSYYPVTFACKGYVFHRNSQSYKKSGVGTCTLPSIGECIPLALYIATEKGDGGGVKTGTFYLPRAMVEMLLAER